MAGLPTHLLSTNKTSKESKMAGLKNATNEMQALYSYYDIYNFSEKNSEGVIESLSKYAAYSSDVKEWLLTEQAPIPVFRRGEEGLYTSEQVKEVFDYFKARAWLLAENAYLDLEKGTVTKKELIDALKKAVSDIEKQNARVRKSDRGNSISDGKQRACAIPHLIDFVTALISARIPDADRREIQQLRNAAEGHVGI
jgi:hypothetical protein